MENSIELRTVINPDEEEIYNFLLKVKNFLLTNSNSTLLRFILGRAAQIPFEEFINLVNPSSDPKKEKEKIQS